MKKLKFERPVKGKSYPDLILDLEACGEGWKEDKSKDKGKYFPIEKDNYIRTIISGIIKAKYPLRVYAANREVVKGIKVLTVRRIE